MQQKQIMAGPITSTALPTQSRTQTANHENAGAMKCHLVPFLLVIQLYSLQPPRLRDLFLQQFLGLVDLGGKVRAATAVGVVEEHECPVCLAHLVFCDGTFV